MTAMLLEVDPPFALSKPVEDERAFYALAGEDDGWELLDGRLVLVPASERHEDLFGFLHALLRGWLDERGGGVVRGSRYPMRLDPHSSPEPDLLVVLDASLHRMTPQRLEGPADLVIEIASDGDPRLDESREAPPLPGGGRARDRARLPAVGDRAGRSTGRARLRDGAARDGLVASSVLPGFGLAVEDLWAEPLPSSLARLRALLGER